MHQDLYVRIVGPDEIQDPQVLAMLQAFYSRSPMSIDDRLAKLLTEGADGETATEKIRQAMQRYYVNYGHASIGDCGGTTVFIENVSMLAAKAIQDNELYNGQECSTRYLDFSKQKFIAPSFFDPLLQTQGKEIHEQLRALYMRVLPLAVEWATKNYDPNLVLSSKIEEMNRKGAFHSTCKAIAFDICRGLLPAGASTSLSWTGSFHNFDQHLRWLSLHPLFEVRSIARRIYSALLAKYPASFRGEVLNPGDEEEHPAVYYNQNEPNREPRVYNKMWTSVPDFPRRPKGRSLDDYSAIFEISGPLDFGSFRDLQRHRHGMNRIPLIRAESQLHPWYVRQFDKIDPSIMEEMNSIRQKLSNLRLGVSATDVQYFMPMATKVSTHMVWNLGQLRYVMDLRTKTSVHPTLRGYFWQLHDNLKAEEAPCETYESQYMTLSVNRDPHYAASDRGEQTIKVKGTQ